MLKTVVFTGWKEYLPMFFAVGERPQGFTHQKIAAGCFVHYRDRILLLHRCCKFYHNYWGIPAGGQEDERDDTIVHAARRELWEETGIVAPPKLLKQRQVAFITLPGFSYVFWMFSLSLNDVPAITLSPYEHDDYRWVTVEEMLELKEKERLFPYTYECLQVLGT